MPRRATRAARKLVIRVARKADMAVVEGLIVAAAAAADGAAPPKAGGALSVAGVAALTGNFGDSQRSPTPPPFRWATRGRATGAVGEDRYAHFRFHTSCGTQS